MLAPESNDIPLFVSGTYLDLQDEHDYILQTVFPILRRRCAGFGYRFAEVHYRWGISSEAVQSGNLIRRVLREISRSHPLFVGILGMRYGYRPSQEDIDSDPTILTDYPWLRSAVSNGWSITEIEIRHALINAEIHGTQPLIYIPERLLEAEADEEVRAVQRLAATIVDRGVCKVQYYSEPEHLARLMLDDLWSQILPVLVPSPDQHESTSTAEIHPIDLFPDTDLVITARVQQLFHSSQGVVVTGKAGSGVSSILAKVEREYLKAFSRAVALNAYVSDISGTDATYMFSRIISDLSRIYPQIHDEMTGGFAYHTDVSNTLAQISAPVLVVIGDLDASQASLDVLEWLCSRLPSNYKILAGSHQPAQVFLNRLPQLDVVGLAELTEADVRQAIGIYSARYRKELPTSVTEALVAAAQMRNRFFLTLVLEEVRMRAQHESLATLIEEYLRSRDLAELVSVILGKIQEQLGDNNLRRVVTVLSASRSGLHEDVLAEVAEIDVFTLHSVLSALDNQMISARGDLVQLHSFVRRKVVEQFGTSQRELAEIQARIGLALERRAHNARHVIEAAWYLREAGLKDQVARLLLRVDVVLASAEEVELTHILGMWYTTHTPEEIRCAMIGGCSSLTPDVPQRTRQEYCISLGRILRAAGHLQEAATVYRTILAECQGENASSDIATGLLISLARVSMELAAFDEASEFVAQAKRNFRDGYTPSIRELADLYRISGLINYLTGRFDDAGEDLSFARTLVVSQYGSESTMVAVLLLDTALVLAAQNNLVRASEMTNNALAVLLPLHGESHPFVLRADSVKGIILRLKGDLFAAIELYNRILVRYEKIYGAAHPQTIEARRTLGNLLVIVGDYPKAQEVLETTVDHARKVYGEGHPLFGDLFYNIAESRARTGDLDAARILFDIALEIQRVAVGHAHPHTVRSLREIIEYLIEAGRNDEAIPYLQKLLDSSSNIVLETSEKEKFEYLLQLLETTSSV